MFRRISDFVGTWKYESDFTTRMMRILTDESLSTKVSAEGRTLARLAWHITQIIGATINQTGLHIESPANDAPIPEHASEIADTYERVAQAALEAIEKNWTDDSLETTHTVFGQPWTRSRVLRAMVTHQIHHRGQMTVLMRQAGLIVPGVYGPAREEWAIVNITPRP